MKVAFVNPPITKEEMYGILAPAGSYAPPLALCSLAAVCRENGHETIIINSFVEGLNSRKTLERIKSFSPQVVGITSTTSTFLNASELAGMIKDAFSDITVVAGGVHVSSLPEDSLLNFRGIDIVVLGEGEETLADLLRVINNNGSLSDVKGIAYREDGKVIFTESRELIQDLDSLPLPAWDLLSGFPGSYSIQAQSVANFPSTSISTSRGCSGKCTFCDRRIFGSRLRAHSAEYVLRVIKDLYHNYGIRDIQFEDDNFMLFRKRLWEICDMLKQEDFDLTWSCQARVDTVNLDTLTKMKDAGCWSILYGIESGSQKILDLMKKRIKLHTVEKAVDITHQAGLRCKGFFIAGYLGEDKETLRETRDFIKKIKFDDISNTLFVPFPGCEAYSSAEKYGQFEKDWRKMNFFEVVFIPEGLSRADLLNHIKTVYRDFYLSPRILINYLRRVKNLRHFLYLIKSAIALLRYIFLEKSVK